MNNGNMSTIKLSEATKKRLEERGKMGDTYEDVIIKLLDMTEENKSRTVT
ncbi:Uncharacterised protein [uncultured archaeon]|nr:Uncharacterised protein [uncultured archaeon]